MNLIGRKDRGRETKRKKGRSERRRKEEREREAEQVGVCFREQSDLLPVAVSIQSDSC